jgi:hypothetical protein
MESGEVGMKSKKPAPRPKRKTTAKLKTQPTGSSVTAFLDGVGDAQRRKDAFTVLALMEKATKAEPKMWGGSIVGFGTRRYESASGRGGDWFVMGFSPRKAALTLYLMGGLDRHGALLKTLGKHKRAKGCLYIRNLEDVDHRVLTTLIQNSLSQR